ncbi:Petrobactin ABC transporter, permease protein I [Nitrincola lacisaponensis]|uniref:Petrobactin ABC transporter, permease protein I n=1 Tax=Nitrincola lacisaponensis TaxID=267850 RepID=A0A063Y5I1_9GAMM|nr:iron chelate uptake ABC transporter family permease subunit [Nitrincola lacisaponensis]KDE40001.1 Petrobactin ABC transporter, permease protein I [Nitrincola lacisaponensis]
MTRSTVHTNPFYSLRWLSGVALLALLAMLSMMVGVMDLSLTHLTDEATQVLLISRIPRTLAVMLTGISLAVAGMVMQMLARNRFVEPSTTGTLESALLGMLVMTLFAPGLGVLSKTLIATAFAMVGSLIFMLLLRSIPLRSTVMVPLVGIMFSSVVAAVATFIAYRFNLLQSLANWTNGDFSVLLRGRYELLWVTLICAVLAYLYADRFTLAGMGRSFTTNLGMNYALVLFTGLLLVSMIAAITVTTAGVVPFLGLVVPNVVSLMMGDNLRRSLPWVALLGAGFMLFCDLLSRLLRYPYEVPVGTVMGVIGSVFFIYLLLKRTQPSHV